MLAVSVAAWVVAVASAGCGGSSSSSGSATTSSSGVAVTAAKTTAPGSSSGSSGPTGTITLSGSISGTLSATGFVVACSVSQGAASGPQGQLVFGSAASAVTLAFNGPAGTNTLPANAVTLLVAKGDLSKTTAAGDSTYAAVGTGASGTITTSGAAAGSIHGSADATLVANQGGATVHVSGNWTC